MFSIFDVLMIICMLCLYFMILQNKINIDLLSKKIKKRKEEKEDGKE